MSRQITFVFIGSKLPKYAENSLSLAKRWSGLETVLIGNDEIRRNKRLDVENFVPLEDFYDAEQFVLAKERVTLPHTFRSGFWLKTLERFFVLSQYMQATNSSHLLHAELDQLLFRTDLLLNRLLSLEETGVFVPFHDENRAVASLLFCNDFQMIQALTNFATSTDPFPNEMMLLANWSKEHPYLKALPTLQPRPDREFNVPPKSVNRINKQQIGGVVDALQLGMWMTGMDPRNVPFYEAPRNHFVEVGPGLLREDDLRQIKFRWNPDDGFLTADSETGSSERVYNLHAHSKIHPWLLKSEGNLNQLIAWTNSEDPRVLPGTRVPQFASLASKLRANFSQNPSRVLSEARKSLNLYVGRRPSSSPYVSGDTFRALADHVWETEQMSLQPTELSDGDIIFCQSDLIQSLNKRVLARCTNNVTVLLGNSDQNHTIEVVTSIAIRSGVRVFAQNLIEEVSGWGVLPIGLENAQLSQNGIPGWFNASRKKKPKWDKTFRVFSSFSIWTNPSIRNQALLSLQKCPVVDIEGQLSARKHHEALREYAFVAAPPGNGADTHRVWEAIYLGCVPIVLESYLTRHYKSIGLPIVVVKDFREVEDWSESSLREKYAELTDKFESEYLWVMKWWDLFQSS